MSEVSKLVGKWREQAAKEKARRCWVTAAQARDCADELEAAIARDRAAQGGGEREADRQRFGDLDFNRWLDDGISDGGHTVYDAVGDVQAAWQGWQAAHSYSSPSYDALLIIAQSVMGALARAGFDDCDDPGEAIDLIAEGKHPNATRPAAEAVGVPEPMYAAMVEADFEKNHVTFEMRGDYVCSAGLYEIRPHNPTAAPSQPEERK